MTDDEAIEEIGYRLIKSKTAKTLRKAQLQLYLAKLTIRDFFPLRKCDAEGNIRT